MSNEIKELLANGRRTIAKCLYVPKAHRLPFIRLRLVRAAAAGFKRGLIVFATN